MKKYKSLFCFLLAGTLLLTVVSGCSKFLDRKPLTTTLEDLNQGALESQVLNMYTILRTSAGFSTLPWLDFQSIRDDDAQKGSDAGDGKEVVTEFDNFAYSKDDWAPNEYWNNHYTMISTCNIALALADSLKVTDAASLRNIGEACFFRAYAYFELVKTYGEVPVFKKPIVLPSDGLLEKSPIATVYEFIDSNLQIASQLLPVTSAEYGATSDNSALYAGRLTKGAANTLWAQTYLFRQNWPQVITLCNQVIASGQYELLGNFSDIWRDGNLNTGSNNGGLTRESIFDMQASVGAANGDEGSKAYNGTAWGTCQQIRQNGTGPEWNLGWGWNTPTQKLVDAWDNKDPRKSQTILYSGQSDGGADLGGFGAIIPDYTNPDGAGGLAQKYWNKKVYTGNDPAMRTFTGFATKGNAGWINHHILRYADVILMLAEASNETSDGTTAAANLELIRKRASGKSGADSGVNRTIVPYIPFVSQEQMRTAIKNERRFEFAMEGYRFYDLVRWGDAIKELGPNYTNRARFYPIPQKAIDQNTKLVQNPEW